MKARRGKRKAMPAIVPRFLKSAVTIGVIPVLAVGCAKPKRVQPVVAYMAPPAPEDAMRPPPPVVAAMVPNIAPPVVAAMAVDAMPAPPVPVDAATPVSDAAVDAATKKAKTKLKAVPPPPVVAALIAPPVVAAMIPRDPEPAPPKKPKKP